MYQPDEDPYLMVDDGSVSSGSRVAHSRNDNYQYQPQSMYQLPVGPPQGQQPYPQNYPPHAQPRRLRSTPSMYANGAPMPQGPVLRATPSFYNDPMMGPPVVGQPIVGQPYGVPVQAQPYGYGQPVPVQGPAYIPNAGYRDIRGNILNDQVEELNRYHNSRPRYNNNEDSSLLIATLVSEQDAMYGTNMLENLTPADLEYIQSLMSRGVPEHEAYRLAFERKPHTVRPPKVAGETVADKKALEDAIQASLTESSRRASRPDSSPNDRADQEALEKAIQLSLQESSSQYSGQTTSNNTQNTHLQNEAYYSGSEFYSEVDEHRRQSAESDTRPFDRQYPYNLSTERPTDTLRRPKPVNTMTEEDYARARTLREAEELRARAYGGGNVVSNSYPYPQHYRHEGGEDEYTVDSRNSRASHGSRGSRTVDSRSQYSYDRHPQPGQGHGYPQGHHSGHHGQYAQNEQAVYSATTHTTVHRTVPGAHHSQPYPPSQHYGAQHGAGAYYRDQRPPSPPQYRVEEAEYDSNSDDEGKDDFDHRRAFVQQGKNNSRSSNYTSTSSISAADEGEYTPRSNEGSFKSNYHQYGNSVLGQSPQRPRSPPNERVGEIGQSARTVSAQYTTVNRSPAVPSPATHPARSASPLLNNPLARVPSFITPRTQSPSPAPSVGGPVPTFRPPVAPAQVTPRVGIAGDAEISTNVTTTANSTTVTTTNAQVSSTVSVDGSVASNSDPSLPQFERRKTLMKLVSKLTIDSDED